VVPAALALLSGCSNCDDEAERASAFIEQPSHRACQTDGDCQVVHVGCAEVQRSFCGQVQLNREAAASQTWQTLSQALDDCQDSSCEICLAGVVPTCLSGLCGGQ
jgi:hypothetical protein